MPHLASNAKVERKRRRDGGPTLMTDLVRACVCFCFGANCGRWREVEVEVVVVVDDADYGRLPTPKS